MAATASPAVSVPESRTLGLRIKGAQAVRGETVKVKKRKKIARRIIFVFRTITHLSRLLWMITVPPQNKFIKPIPLEWIDNWNKLLWIS